MEVLKVTEVTKSFDYSGKRLEVLQKNNFVLQKNQVIGIVGPTGCGKTTLLKIIAGLDVQTSGKVIVNEQSSEHKSKIGMMFQSPTLLPWRNIFENIRLPLELAQIEINSTVEKNIGEVITSVGLNGFEEYYPSKISGGMQARTALARALVLRPPILLLDEPFASIDEITRFSMCGLLIKVFKEFNSSAILVTHSLNEAVLLSDKVIVLSPRPANIVGEVIIRLPKEKRLQEPEHSELIHARKQIRQLLEAGLIYDKK